MYLYGSLSEFYNENKVNTECFLIRANDGKSNKYIFFDSIEEYVDKLMERMKVQERMKKVRESIMKYGKDEVNSNSFSEDDDEINWRLSSVKDKINSSSGNINSSSGKIKDKINSSEEYSQTSFQYHEVMLEDRRRKMYFDVDISGDVDIILADKFVNILIQCSINHILGIPECSSMSRDFLADRITIFNSHKPGTKLSYHVIIQGLAFQRVDLKYRCGKILQDLKAKISGEILNVKDKICLDNVQTLPEPQDLNISDKDILQDLNISDKDILQNGMNDNELILSSIWPSLNPEDILSMKHEWVDSGVYSKNQCLRTVGSTKDGRMKVFSDVWNYDNCLGLRIFGFDLKNIIKYSCVTLCDDCILVKPDPESVKMEMKFVKHHSFDINSSLIQRIESHISPTFEIREVLGNGMIILDRKESSFCDICERYHAEDTKGDNPFITVKENSSKLTEVRFHCRRNKDKSLILFSTMLYTKSGDKLIQSMYNHQLNILSVQTKKLGLFLSEY